MKPLHDLCVIELDEQPEKTETGIFITKAWEGPISSATVIAVGPEVSQIKAGMHVIINPYAYFDVPDTKQKFIKEEDILGND